MPTAAEWLPLGTAFVLGLIHALEVDHMIAVTAFISTRPAVRAAGAFGLRWGLGHSAAVGLAGGLLLASGFQWSPRYQALGEALVGLMLIGVGAWAIRASRRLHLHSPPQHGDHAHVHVHSPAVQGHEHPHREPTPARHHDHRHAMTLVGVAHGLVGTTTVVALVPVTLVDRVSIGVLYLAAFGLGTVVAMAAFAMLVALAMRRTAERFVTVGRRMSSWTGAAGIAIGAWWFVRALTSS